MNYIELDLDLLVSRYREGRSINELAWDFGVSRGTVRTRLLSEGVKLRKPGCQNRKRIPLDLAKVAKLRREGKVWTEIASELGVHVDTLRARRQGR